MLCANETFIFYKLLCFSHPLGALPMGTIVHIIKKIPGEGRRLCQACWASAQVLRKVGDKVILCLPSKHEIALSFNCMATVGQMSNSGHDDDPWKWVGGRWVLSTDREQVAPPEDRLPGKKIKPKRTFIVKPTPPKYETYKLSGDWSVCTFLIAMSIMLNNNIILCFKKFVEKCGIFLLPCCKNLFNKFDFYSYKVCYF